MNPKHDFKGGNASDDSFAMSNRALVASMNRCFLAADRQWDQDDSNNVRVSHRNLIQEASHHAVSEKSQTWWRCS